MKSSSTYCYYLALLYLCLCTSPAFAQSLTVSNVGNNGNVNHLVQNVLVGGCLTVNNITYSGNANAIGYFSNATPLGISDGIILSSGNIAQAAGDPISFANTSYFGAGDLDLNALPGSLTQDAAIIEFDFLPLSSSLSFDFIFASEEYPEFVNTNFNDVFGFFISGPGITGQQNIALVPGTTTPITINTVNAITNSQYYLANVGTTTQYDGYTKVLTAVATGLSACQTYHIKLALADASDAAYDSAVFLAANSFNAGQSITVEAVVPSTNTSSAYEGCQDGYFVFTRPADADLSEPLVIPISIGGTAQANIDYDALPSQAVIAAGDTAVTLPIIAYTDWIAEGSESIIVTPDILLCNCQQPVPDTLNIYDSPDIFEAASSTDPTICPGSGAMIAVIAGGSQFTPYTYQWSNGGTSPIISVAPNNTTAYTVTVTDGCGRSFTQLVNVNVSNVPPTADIVDVPALCSLDAPVTLEVTTNGGTFSGTGVNPNTGVFDPSNLAAGSYTISYDVANNCGSDTDQTTIVVDTPTPIVISPVPTQCANGLPISLTANKPNGVWSGDGIVGGSNTTGAFDPALAFQNPPPYTVTYTVAGNCGGTANLNININPIPSITLSGGGTVCNLGQVITLQTNSTGVGPWQVGYTINGVAQNNITINNPNAVFNISGNTGAYNVVSIADANGCIGNVFGSASINVSNLTATALVTPANCFGDGGNVQALPINGALPYTYQWSNPTIGNVALANALPVGNYTVTITDANNCTASATASLTEPTVLALNINDVVATCAGQNQGSFSLAANGGTMPYVWSTGEQNTNSISIDHLVADSYEVVVTDANNCSSQVTVLVDEFVSPTTSIVGNTLICENSSSELCVDSPFVSYLWSSGQADHCISTSLVGTYTVTVTDGNACTATATTHVDNDSFLLDSYSSNLFCENEATGTISINPIGGTVPFSYIWNDASLQGNSLIGLPAATYSVTVTDLIGCSQTAQFSLSAPPPLVASIALQQAACNSNTANLNATAQGGTPPYNFFWGNGLPEMPNLSNVAVGTYTVTVSDAGNCIGTQSVSVGANAPINIVGNVSPTTCGQSNGSIALSVTNGTPPYSFSWSNGLGNVANPNNLVAGTYGVTVTDSHQCSSSASFSIANSLPISLAEQHQGVTCFGNSDGQISLTVNGGNGAYSFVWSHGSNLQNLDGLVAQTYTVTVSDSNNCSQSTSIVIGEPAGLQLNANALDLLCNNVPSGSISLVVSGGTVPYGIVWSNGSTASSLSNLPAGSYGVTVTDAQQCSASAVYSLEQPTALSLLSTVSNANCNANNGQIQLTVDGGTMPYVYTWSNSSQTTNQLQNIGAASYTVTVTDNHACSATANIVVANTNAPSIDLLMQQNTSCGQNNGGLSVAIGGGTGNSSLLWSNGNTTNSLSNLSSGVYSLTVTDAANCQAIANFEVLGSSSPHVVVNSVTNSTCGQSNGSIVWQVIGGLPPYDWQSADDTWQQNNLAAGVYSLTVSDANQCSAVADQSISTSVAPTIVGSNVVNSSCGWCNGAISYEVLGEGSMMTYLWSDGSGDSTRSELCAGDYSVTVTDAFQCSTSSSFVVTPSEPLSLSFVNTVAPACGQCNGQLGVVVNNVLPNETYLYQWSDGASDSLVTDLCAGSYVVTVTNGAACSATDSVSIAAADAPSITNSVNSPEHCGLADGSLSVSVVGGTGALQYDWSNGVQNTAVLNDLSAGTYSLTVTDANNCSVSQVFELGATLPPSLSIDSQTNANCGQNNGSVVLGVGGNLSDYTFSWDTPAGNAAVANNLGAGTYQVTVSDADGCSSTLAINIGNEGSPNVVISHVAMSSCGGNNGAIDLEVSGGNGGLSYDWTNDVSDGSSAAGLGAGTYFVTVTDANNCQSIVSATVVDAPVGVLSVLAVTPDYCGQANGTASLSATGATPFVWTWSNGGVDSVATDLVAGSYGVTVTDANGCSVTSELVVPIANAPIISAVNSVSSSCGQSNGSLVVSTNPSDSLTFAWSDSSWSGNAVGNLAAGVYGVTVTDAHNCSVDSSLVVMAINSPTLVSSVVNGTSCGLANGSIALDIDGALPLTYVWSDVALTGNHPLYVEAGDYAVTVTDGNNCSLSVGVSVAASMPVTVSLEGEGGVCGQNMGSVVVHSNDAVEPIVYVWNDSSLGNNDSLSNLHVGVYSVTISDGNGCSASASVNVTGSLPPPEIWCSGNSENSVSFAWNAVANSTGYLLVVGNDSIVLSGTEYSIDSLLPNQIVGVQIVALGDAWCSSSAVSSAECSTNNCPSLSLSLGISDSILCLNDSPVSLTPNVVGGTFTGNVVVNDVFDPAQAGVGSHDIGYTYTDDNGCVYSTSETIQVVALPVLSIVAADTVCVGVPVQVTVQNAAAATHYTWYFNGETQNGRACSIIAPDAGSLALVVMAEDEYQCRSSDTIALFAQMVSVELAGDTTVLSGSLLPLVAQCSSSIGSPLSYAWVSQHNDLSCSDCPMPSSVVVDGDSYGLWVTDEQGCSASDVMEVGVWFDNSLIYPTAFSPNGDGVNDYLGLQGHNIARCEVAVYDRWGNLVLMKDGSDVSQLWNGQNRAGRDCEIGTYVFYARVFFSDGKEQFVKGNVTLLR